MSKAIDFADAAFANEFTKLVGDPQDFGLIAQHDKSRATNAVAELILYLTGTWSTEASEATWISDVATYVDTCLEPDQEISNVTWREYIDGWRDCQ